MSEELTTRERFEQEQSHIAFIELQKHFAKGIIVIVTKELSLIDVAMKLHEDDADAIASLINQEKLVRAHDEHAKKWLENNSILRAVTAAPWVLVQEIINEEK